MLAIVIGAGKLGYSIARLLAEAAYDVTLIDKNESRLQNIEERLDVNVLVGNGASIVVLEEAGIAEAKLMVAVTESDEVNMVACMLGKQAGVEQTIARVRNPEYLEEQNPGKTLFSGIDLIINPEMVTAREISKLIEVPEALDVVYFAKGKLMLLELPIHQGTPAEGARIDSLKNDPPFLIVAISRNHEVIIPKGKDRLLAGDVIFLLARTKDMADVELYLGTERKQTAKVMILGGGRVGHHLAKILDKRDYSVRIIEKEYRTCVALSESLRNTLVIHGDATDIDLLRQEGASNADVFVSVTDDDKVNLLASLIAKHLGAQRAITQVRRSDYVGLMEGVGIDIGVSPRVLTANAILRFIKKSANLLSVTFLSQEGAEMLEFEVNETSKVSNMQVKNISFPARALVASICRNDQAIIAKGNDYLKPGDQVTVFCMPQAIDDVIRLFKSQKD